MPRLPPQEGFQSAPLKPPLRIPPMGTGAVSQWSASICGIGPGEKIKDGRHVGLDFYDLLIEAFSDVSASGGIRATRTERLPGSSSNYRSNANRASLLVRSPRAVSETLRRHCAQRGRDVDRRSVSDTAT